MQNRGVVEPRDMYQDYHEDRKQIFFAELP